jgi:hypothetical protein
MKATVKKSAGALKRLTASHRARSESRDSPMIGTMCARSRATKTAIGEGGSLVA